MGALADAMAAGLAEQPKRKKSDLARACGVTPTAVGRWLNGSAPEERCWPLIDDFFAWPAGRTADLVTPELTGKRRSTADATTAALRARIAELEAELEELRSRVPRPARGARASESRRG